ncbi:MAG: 4-alpha-glucanotransferase [Sphingobacteriales bacterium]|nr:4-alpha-glucanotransferase [Sphingobacteriales bacterium]OJY81580.1 MAG: 4-alpha-glucanotransferase [Sphingobacteriales bacterium 44-15]
MATIHFYIRFSTQFGQGLLLSGNIAPLGNGDTARAVNMQYLNDSFWHYELQLDNDLAALKPLIEYRYLLREKNGSIQEEWPDGKCIDITKITAEEICVTDTWNFAGQNENALYTDPFQQVLLPAATSPVKPRPYRGNTHIFKVKAPLLQKDEVICLLGSSPALGSWIAAKAVWMSKEGIWWTVKLNLGHDTFPVAYKYAVFNAATKAFVRYEDGDNRLLHDNNSKKKVTILHDGFVHFSNNTWRGAGVSIPVFSLRSSRGSGVGEFTDIKLLADWAKKAGLRLIQLLPVNDTIHTKTWRDSYPYNAISAFALHPLYLDLEEVARTEDKAILEQYSKKKKELNELPEVDYEKVMLYKWNIIKKLYRQQKRSFLKDPSYLDFFEKSRSWLVPYAAYSYLRDKNKTADFSAWEEYAIFNAAAVEELCSPSQKDFDQAGIYFFIQYHLHKQLKSAADYAHKKGIILKGDIPIGVNRHSCDAWMEPKLFHMDMQAGAPPDDFADKGQNWGFPTYNWEMMEHDHFEWWKRRFEQMSCYFDAFRIDHILGFFRIWSIPAHAVEGVMGLFVPAVPVHINEFARKGITFEYARFCRPFINDDVLRELLGENTAPLMDFLTPHDDGTYSLKEAFATQRQVEAYFATQEITDENVQLQSVLYDLVSNVIVFEAEQSPAQHFHFRIDIDKTSSFRHLDAHTQYLLKELYVDYFYRRQDDHWASNAMRKLPALKRSTNMLICGEDLGMVPSCVPGIMRVLGILSLDIQRMPKQPGVEFFNPATARYLSVITPSTHDMSTIRAWWEENREKTQRFFNNEMQHPGLAPFYCEPWINKFIIIQHLYSPAMWSIFQLQDIMGIDSKLRREDPAEERINIPAIPRYYWRYRMHIPLEQLLKEADFNKELLSYITLSGRAKTKELKADA